MKSRVLIVEPNRDVRESFAVVCEMWGYEVATSTEGKEALLLVAVFDPDVVLLDLCLPGTLDGAEVTRRIRETEGDDIFIIAITGWAPASERLQALEAGADAFFLKPPDLTQLQTTIERATQRRVKRR